MEGEVEDEGGVDVVPAAAGVDGADEAEEEASWVRKMGSCSKIRRRGPFFTSLTPNIALKSGIL